MMAAEACSAQVVFFPVGLGGTAGAFVGGRNFGYFPQSYGPSYYPSTNYYNPGYSSFSSMSYYTIAPTPLYYGAASFAPAYASTARIVSPSLDVAYRAANSVTAAAYTAPAYPVQSPNYTSIYPVSPPLAVAEAYTAKVEVHVPAEAEIWFEGQKTCQTGTDRTYTSPALDVGDPYVYEVRACWRADGKEVRQTRKVTVHAGARVRVDFLRP